jgi:hypothetical protein
MTRPSCSYHYTVLSLREIAAQRDRSRSTISRKPRHNAATRSGCFEYRATTAQWHADLRAKRPRVGKPAANDALRDYVRERFAGLVTAPDGMLTSGPSFPGLGGGTAVERTGAGPAHGARSRSR